MRFRTPISYVSDRSIGVPVIVLLLCGMVCAPKVAAQSTVSYHVYPFTSGGQVGLMDHNGRMLAEPVFDEAGRSQGSVIPLRAGARWGLWSAADSAWVVDAAYSEAVIAGDSLLSVRTAEGWTHLSFSGRRMSDAAFHAVRDAVDGVFPAAVLEDQGPVDDRVRWGVFSAEGDTLAEPRFENMYAFTDGLAAARISRRLLGFIRRSPRWGFIGPDGAWRIPPDFDSARSFVDGLALVSAGGELFFIDRAGERRFTVEHDLAYSFSEGRARIVDQGLWGWIDTDGRIAVEPAWEGALDFSEGLAAVRRAGKWGYVDREGRVVISMQYESAASFRGPLAEVIHGGRPFRINRSGREVAPGSAGRQR